MKVEVRPQFWMWLGLAAYAVAVYFVWCGLVSAHDIYTTLKQPDGVALCCGGTDCEAVAYKILPTGDAIVSPRKNVQGEVLVPKDKITWMQVPGGEYSEAHWCGRKRYSGTAWGSVNDGATTPDQPDPTFWTYCAFIAPGGV
jgi:hypothetical protein